MEFCARLGTLLHLPLNAERLRKLTETYVVSNAKIKAALGIDRMPVRAEEGIVRTIKSVSYTHLGFKVTTAGHQLDINFLNRLKTIILLSDYTCSNSCLLYTSSVRKAGRRVG